MAEFKGAWRSFSPRVPVGPKSGPRTFPLAQHRSAWSSVASCFPSRSVLRLGSEAGRLPGIAQGEALGNCDSLASPAASHPDSGHRRPGASSNPRPAGAPAPPHPRRAPPPALQAPRPGSAPAMLPPAAPPEEPPRRPGARPRRPGNAAPKRCAPTVSRRTPGAGAAKHPLRSRPGRQRKASGLWKRRKGGETDSGLSFNSQHSVPLAEGSQEGWTDSPGLLGEIDPRFPTQSHKPLSPAPPQPANSRLPQVDRVSKVPEPWVQGSPAPRDSHVHSP